MLKQRSILRCAGALALVAGVALAAERTISIADYSGRGFAPDLVQYTVNNPPAAEAVALIDADGQPLPFQLVPAQDGKTALLSFVAEVGPNATVAYKLVPAKGAAPTPQLTVATSTAGLEISNGLLSLRVPPVQAKTFHGGVPASTLPAPILAFRSGASDWLGESRILATRKAKAFRATLTASGPAYAEVQYEIEWQEGGFYRARLQVIDRVPVVKVTEEFDLGTLDGNDVWELQLAKGWAPDTMETARTYANGGGVDRGSNKPLTKLADIKNPRIIPDNICFSLSYIGLLNKPANGEPQAGPMAGFVPLHKGAWRKMNVVPIRSAGTNDIRLHLAMSARDATWWDDTTSETSPFSMQEHDPTLSQTYGRRLWALALGKPVVRSPEKSTVRYTYFRVAQELSVLGPFAQVRSFYGTVGLDRYKDFLLDWPADKVSYPVLFPAHAQKPVPAKEGKELEQFMNELRGLCNAPITCPTISHHLCVGTYKVAGRAEALLARQDLPETLRTEIRRRVALIMYLFEEPDFISYGNGAHTGNPNMGTSRYSGVMAFLPLVKGHPMFEQWREHVSRYAEYKMATQIAPGGSYIEFGTSYHMHGYARTANSLPGLVAAKADNADRLYADYHKPDWDYFMNLLTPVDPRFGTRMIPGLANAGPGHVGHLLEAAGSVARNDPALASHLRWAWEANGSAKPDNPWIVDHDVKPVRPELTSRIYPGFGVIFRAHQGPDETYMLLRSGFDWSHWYIDQGHMTVMSRRSIILPYQSYAYWGAKDRKQKVKDFDYYNVLRFGHPENEYPAAWPDGNVLDHAFGPTVDYAWVSTGLPDWFITPSINPVLKDKLPPEVTGGMMRQLDKQFQQTEGAFAWDRQVVFLKGATATSPNYFVIRDSFAGEGKLASYTFLNLLGAREHITVETDRLHLDTDWPVKADLVFPGAEKLALAFYEEQQKLDLHHVRRRTEKPVRDWGLGPPGKRGKVKGWEHRTVGRLASAPGEGRTWVIYPRTMEEPGPDVRELGKGVIRVEHPEGVDTIFLSTTPITYAQDGVTFEGMAGTVRLGKGTVTLALSAGSGRVGYRDRIYQGVAPIEVTLPLATLKPGLETVGQPGGTFTCPSLPAAATQLAPGVTTADTEDGTLYRLQGDRMPVHVRNAALQLEACNAFVAVGADTIRFVNPEATYARLTVGNQGVRGLGPFDLTFSVDAITGTVQGKMRTLVTTRPQGIEKPMYAMDGKRYFAGWADDHCIGKGAETPQFAIAFGVTEGNHTVNVSEWTYPPLPPTPARGEL